MNNKERMELAKWATRFAQKKGATEASVNISRSRSVQVEVREQKIENIKESTENGLSLQIYRDNKYSGHNTNNLSKKELEHFISEAVEATKYLSADPDRTLPDPSLYPVDMSMDLGLSDPDYAKVTPEFRVQTAMQTEQIIRDGNAGLLSAAADFNDNLSESVRVHSNGFEGQQASTYFGTSASLTIRDRQYRPAGYFWGGSRFLNALPSPEEVASKTTDDTTRQLGQTKIASGQYTMILENRVAGNMIWRLFQPMNARAIHQKSSFLDGMLEKAVASPLLTITDDPFIKGGLGSRIYDHEGIAAQKRVLIENGVLKSYLVDNYYGRKLGITPNGSSTSNVLLALGTRTPDQIISSMDKAIVVTSFNGGNANSTTGDFSFGISGLLIEKGKVIKPVNEMNISGNAKTFWHNLIETGNDPYPYSSLQSPTMVFQMVDFSGL
jgi:PmbA protein